MDQTNVTFSGEEFQTSPQTYQRHSSKIIQWVIKSSGGLIKNETQASYVLTIFILLALITALFVFLGSVPSVEPSIPSPNFNPQET